MPNRNLLVSSIMRVRSTRRRPGPASAPQFADNRGFGVDEGSISPEATERVPSLSLQPDGALRCGNRHGASVARRWPHLESSQAPQAWPATNALPKAQLDANHLKPFSSHVAAAGGRRLKSPQIRPPARSVGDCAASPSPLAGIEVA